MHKGHGHFSCKQSSAGDKTTINTLPTCSAKGHTSITHSSKNNSSILSFNIQTDIP